MKKRLIAILLLALLPASAIADVRAINGSIKAINGTLFVAANAAPGRGTIAANHLTTGTSVADGPFVTASIAPASNALVLLGMITRNAVASYADPSSVSGNGLTWVKVSGFRFDTASSYRDLVVYRAMAVSPSAGAVTISYAGVQTTGTWSIVEFTGVDTGGTNGSAAVVQSAQSAANNTTSPATATLSAFEHSSNAAFGLCGVSSTGASFTVGGGFTSLGQSTGTNNGLMTEWKAGEDTTVDFSDSTGFELAVIGLEIKSSS